MVAGEALASPDGSDVRFGPMARSNITDGPFLETKEALGGFYLIETATVDDAAELRVRSRSHRGLVVEIRSARLTS